MESRKIEDCACSTGPEAGTPVAAAATSQAGAAEAEMTIRLESRRIRMYKPARRGSTRPEAG